MLAHTLTFVFVALRNAVGPLSVPGAKVGDFIFSYYNGNVRHDELDGPLFESRVSVNDQIQQVGQITDPSFPLTGWTALVVRNIGD